MKRKLDTIITKISEYFDGVNDARDTILKIQREVIRCASLSIRAVHRGEFEKAEGILQEASKLFADVSHLFERYPELYHSGYVHDAQKEYAEAHITYALVKRLPIPAPEDLPVEYAAYLNGMGEAIGELRRFILDKIRHDEFEDGDPVLDLMEELYCALTSVDYPDAITRGLRRTTDVARSIIEKTRGDLTQNVSQKRLTKELEAIGAMVDSMNLDAK